jgi:hypothetical protein
VVLVLQSHCLFNGGFYECVLSLVGRAYRSKEFKLFHSVTKQLKATSASGSQLVVICEHNRNSTQQLKCYCTRINCVVALGMNLQDSPCCIHRISGGRINLLIQLFLLFKMTMDQVHAQKGKDMS